MKKAKMKTSHYWQWTAAAMLSDRVESAVNAYAENYRYIATAAECAEKARRVRRSVKRGESIDWAVKCAFTYICENGADANADRRRRADADRAAAERAAAERAERIAAINAMENDDIRAERIAAAERAAAERAAAVPSKKYAQIDYSGIPVSKFEYITKTGKNRTIFALNDGTTAAAVINALKVCRSVVRQRLRMISKTCGTNIPKKLVDRLTRFKTQYGKMSVAYVRGAENDDITAIYTALAIDDCECYEMFSTALTVILSAPISLTIMRAAAAAVKKYLESEKKDDSARAFSLDDNISAATERAAAVEYVSYKEWVNGTIDASENDRKRISDIRAAICAVLATMRRYQRAAVIQYGIQRDILANKRGGGIPRGGYAPTAAALNSYLTAAQRAALYNSDISEAKKRGQYDYNVAAVRHSVETFRNAFSAKYAHLLCG